MGDIDLLFTEIRQRKRSRNDERKEILVISSVTSSIQHL